MLQTLRIRELVLVEDWTLDFASGLTLLTGETGAGKSIVVDALGLITGQRADRSLVRHGADRAIVEAAFALRPGSAAGTWCSEQGLDEIVASGQLVIRREIRVEGSGMIRLNGSPCTLGMLRELGGRLLELHGQHEQQSLLEPDRHRELIDRFGGHVKPLAAVAVAYGNLHQAQRRLGDLESRSADREKRLAELRADLHAIETVAPQPGEMAQLDVERRVQANAVQIGELLDTVLSCAQDQDDSAASLATRAARAAAKTATIDPGLSVAANQLASAAVEIEDAAEVFRDYRAALQLDPDRLDQIETRRAALRDLLLRFGETEEAVLEHADKLRAEMESYGSIGDTLDGAHEALTGAQTEYRSAAAKLTRARVAAAKRLAPQVEAELSELAMPKARFGVEWPAVGSPNLRGAEGVAFQLAANPGEGLRPLNKVASGGELSRLMLALHAILDDAGGGRTLVFDEVDSGVGGGVADAIGSRLATLARGHQVLCVTHLPQVAAHGDGHLRISKTDRGGRTYAAAEMLDRSSRIEELARMLAGRTPTELSRQHAAELLAAAHGRAQRRQV